MFHPPFRDGETRNSNIETQCSFSVAMAWTQNAPLGDRVLYVEGKYDNKMMVRPKAPFLQAITGGSVLRKPDGPEAMRNTLLNQYCMISRTELLDFVLILKNKIR